MRGIFKKFTDTVDNIFISYQSILCKLKYFNQKEVKYVWQKRNSTKQDRRETIPRYILVY